MTLILISAFTTLLESTIAEEHGCLHQLCVYCLLATSGERERSPLPEDRTPSVGVVNYGLPLVDSPGSLAAVNTGGKQG